MSICSKIYNGIYSWIDQNFKILYIIGYWLLEVAGRLIIYLNWDYFQLSDDIAENEYYFMMFIVISDLFSFFELFRHCKCINKRFCTSLSKKKLNEDDSENNNNNKNICQIICNKNIILSTIGIFSLDLLGRLSFFIAYKIIDVDNNVVSQKLSHDGTILVDTVFRIASYIIFNINLNYTDNHKVFSLVSILIILGILVIIDVIHMVVIEDYPLTNCLKYFGILIPRAIIYPVIDTLTYKMIIKNEIPPIGYIRYRGVIETVWSFGISIVLYYSSVINVPSFNEHFFIVGVLYIFFGISKSILLINVIYYYTSLSVSFLIISESLAGSLHEIIDFFKNHNMFKIGNIFISFSEIILIILIGIVTMIYGEIITIKKWGLSDDLGKDIAKRGDKDINQLDSEEPLSNSDSIESVLKIKNG